MAKLDGGAGSNSNGYFAQGSSRLAALECILRDIANPGPQGFSVSTASTSGGGSGGVGSPSPLDDGPLAAFFPVARHKDFYDGHSWASGLFPMANGKSQESVSEAVNAYYSVHLLGVALGDHALSKWYDRLWSPLSYETVIVLGHHGLTLLSRFFRTILYAQIHLSTRFQSLAVLHRSPFSLFYF